MSIINSLPETGLIKEVDTLFFEATNLMSGASTSAGITTLANNLGVDIPAAQAAVDKMTSALSVNGVDAAIAGTIPLIIPIIPSIGTKPVVAPIPAAATPVTSSPPMSATRTAERLETVFPRYAKNFTDKYDYKERGEIAYIKLLKGPSITNNRNPVDSSLDTTDFAELTGEGTGGYRKFLLTDSQVSYNEQMQIHKTFGDGEVTYFFGRQPMVFNFTGVLFDSLEQDWFTKFIYLYAEFLRGTQLAKNYELVSIVLPNISMKGYITGLSHSQNSTNDTLIPFNFQFLAKEVSPRRIPKDDIDVSKIAYAVISWTTEKNKPPTKIAKLINTGRKFGKSTTTFGVGGWKKDAKPSAAIEGFRPLKGIVDDISAKEKNKEISPITAAFKDQIFSPVYGILTSISKVIKTNTGDITKILSSVSSPTFDILKGIQVISEEAVSVISLVEGGLSDILAIPDRGMKELDRTLKSLKGAAGAITSLPENLSQIIQRTARGGRFSSKSAVLKSSKKPGKSKAAILTSGPLYTPRKAYTV